MVVVVVDVDVDAVDRVDGVGEAVEVDVDDVVDVVQAGELLDDRQRQLRAPVGVGGVEPVDPVAGDVHLQVARDRHHRDLVGRHPEQDRGVGAAELIRGALVRAEDQDRLRVARIGHLELAVNRRQPAKPPRDALQVDEQADRRRGRHRDDDQQRPGHEAGPQAPLAAAPPPGRARRAAASRRRAEASRRAAPARARRRAEASRRGRRVRRLAGGGDASVSRGGVLGRARTQPGERGLARRLAIGQRLVCPPPRCPGSAPRAPAPRRGRAPRPAPLRTARPRRALPRAPPLRSRAPGRRRALRSGARGLVGLAPLSPRPGRRRRRLGLVLTGIAQPSPRSEMSPAGPASARSSPVTKSTIACR